jgi:plastocyanin
VKLALIGWLRRSDWLAASAVVMLLGAGCGTAGTPSEGRTTTPPATGQPLPVAGSPAPYTAATCEPSGSRIVLVAKGDEFSLDCMATSAGVRTAITFVNRDFSSHNLAIYADPKVGVLMPVGYDYPALFRGDRISKQTVFKIPPLESGTYYFRCDIHPLMNGTFLVL